MKKHKIKMEGSEMTVGSEFIQRANDTSFDILPGIIESVYIVDDSVFAIVRKDYGSRVSERGDQIEHGDGLFNGTDRTPTDNITIAELAIPTNIDASSNVKRYIGKKCFVYVKNNVAVSAEVSLGFSSLTTISIDAIRRVRESLSSKTEDIFSKEGRETFRQQGYTNEEIENLSNFKYTEDMVGKINTFSGEGLWFKDTSKQDVNENILPPNPLVVGLNKLSMKSKTCHIPSRLFSGK